MTSNGHVTGNVTWQMATWRKTPLDPDRSRLWHQYVGAHYLRFDWRHTLSYDFLWPQTSRSSRCIRIEKSYECYSWHWTDSVFFWTLSCWIKICNPAKIGTHNTCVKNRLKIINRLWKNEKNATTSGGGFFWLTLYTGNRCFAQARQ